MIIYFSATGNSKYVAGRLAAAGGGQLISITECIKTSTFTFRAEPGESVGFVTPTYFWTLPSLVSEFLEKLTIENTEESYIYHVLTCGLSTGAAQSDMEHALGQRGLTLQGKFAVTMVDTWTPMFDLSDAEKNKAVTAAAEPQIDEVIRLVSEKTCGDFNRIKGPRLLASLMKREYRARRKTSNFQVLDSCTGCGLCARVCPSEAIVMEAGRPVRVKETCVLCLSCLHRCPVFAVQYGKKTKDHGQFVNPNVEL